MENWREFPGWPWYEVSDLGRVRRVAPGPATRPGRVLAGGTISGYPSVTVRGEGGAQNTFLVHHIVAEAFLPPCPGEHSHGGYQLDHINGCKTDNRAMNLRWVTPEENEANKNRLGRTARGSRHGQAVLTEKQVSEIRSRYVRGVVGTPRLAKEYGLSQSQVYNIVSRRNWRHI